MSLPPIHSSDDRLPHVAVLVDTATGWGRNVIRGVVQYAEKHGPWHLTVRASGRSGRHLPPSGWDGDGIVARINTAAMYNELKATGSPTVNISAIELPHNDFPSVTSDYQSIAKMALGHFLNQGLRNFAYVGSDQWNHGKQHRDAFIKTCRDSGHDCSVRPFRRQRGKNALAVELKNNIEWLRSLTKPVGIFTWATDEGRDLIESCCTENLSVPHDVAILSGDYDDLLCDASTPKLSGIIVPGKQIGHNAAHMLSQLMRGEVPPETRISLPPAGIAEHPSTDTLAVDDPDLIDAIKFIRAHACDPIQVSDVLRVVPTSRRTLERRFTEFLGRTPTDEIRRIRLGRAKALLATTDMSIDAIAGVCGYGTYNYLARVFRSEFGLAPRNYRQQTQGR